MPPKENYFASRQACNKEAYSSSSERKHVTTKVPGNEKSGQSYGTFNGKISQQSHTVIDKALSSAGGRVESISFHHVIHHETKIKQCSAN